MATYIPLPFVPERLDQTSQRLSLAQMAYQAELARIQAMQQAQMQQGQFIASLGQAPMDFLDAQLRMSTIRDQQRRQEEALRMERAYREDMIQSRLRDDARAEEQLRLAREQADARQLAEQQRTTFDIGQRGGLTPEQRQSLEGTPYASQFKPDYGMAPQTLASLAPGASSYMAPAERFVPVPTLAEQRKQEEEQRRRDAGMGLGYSPAQVEGIMAGVPLPPAPSAAGQTEAERLAAMTPEQRQSTLRAMGAIAAARREPPSPPKPEPPPDPTVQQRIMGSSDFPNYLPNNVKYALERITTQMPSAQAKQFAETISDVGRQYNDETRRPAQLGRLAENAARIVVQQAPNDVEKRMISRVEGYKQFERFKDKFAELERQGVPTGFTKALLEGTLRKFGKTDLDPKTLALMTEVEMAFVEWRRLMTGVAFSPAESRQYEKLWPSLANSTTPLQNINLSIIDGAMNSMREGARAFFETNMGKELTDAYMNRTFTSSNQNMGGLRRPGANPFPPSQR